MYPLNKYHYIVHRNRETGELTGKVTAFSTYAGKTVYGVAKCAPGDTFDEEVGKKIAALRCAQKIAQKRVSRAMEKRAEAYENLIHAQMFFNKMDDYLEDALSEKEDVDHALADVMLEF